MKMKKRNVAALMLAGILLVSLAGCGDSGSGGSSGESTAAAGGDLFKNMAAKDLQGNGMDSSVFKENKLTLINVWNVGCTPCIEEIPVLDKLNREYKDKGVAIKGLYYNFGNDPDESERAAIDDILTKAKASYPHIVPSAEMYASDEMQELRAFPTTYFVDAEGTIIRMTEGARDYNGWKRFIDDVLQEVEGNA